MKKQILFICISILNLNIIAQNLPVSKLNYESKLENKIELFTISYDGSNYRFDYGSPISSIKNLKDSVCNIIHGKQIDAIDIPSGYVSIELDRKADIVVLDSIRNELQGLHFYNVLYKIKSTSSNGFLLRLNIASDKKIEKLNSKGYYPQKTNWDTCKETAKSDSEEYEQMTLPITRQIPPKDLYVRIKDNELKGLEANKDMYIVEYKKKKLYIDSIEVHKKMENIELGKVVIKGNYVFIVDMNNENVYNDYIQIMEKLMGVLKDNRENYATKLIDSGKKRDYSEYMARRKYPFSLFSYFPSDALYNE